jgi:hypothetical protein
VLYGAHLVSYAWNEKALSSTPMAVTTSRVYNPTEYKEMKKVDFQKPLTPRENPVSTATKVHLKIL